MVRDNEPKMVIGESMMDDDIDIREDEKKTDDQEESIKEALAEIREKPDTKEVSSEYFAGYKTMIAEMKAN
jgi:hypothetical protein